MEQRRTLHLLIALLLGLMALAGCSPRGGESQPVVELQFWNGFSGPDGSSMEKVVQDFNASQKSIRVSMQIIPWGTYYDKVTLGLAFGGAPDIFIVHAPRLAEYASQGVLQQWDAGMLQRAGLDPKDFIERPWEAAHYQGEQVGVPLDCHPIGLYYNLDLFKKAGIERPPQSYQEFLEAARKLTLDTNGDGKPDQWGFAFTWLHSNGILFLNQHGTAFLTDDLQRSGIDTPEGRAALRQMVEIWKEKKVAPRPEGQDAWLGFLTGKVAMALEGVYMKSGLDNQKGLRYAAAPAPQFGPVKATWAGSHMMCLPKGASPAKREAALKFVGYLSDHSLAWAEGGQLAVRKSILRSPGFRALKVQAEFAKQLPYVVFEPPSTKLNQLSSFGDAAIEGAVNELVSVDEAAETAGRRMQTVLDRGVGK